MGSVLSGGSDCLELLLFEIGFSSCHASLVEDRTSSVLVLLIGQEGLPVFDITRVDGCNVLVLGVGGRFHFRLTACRAFERGGGPGRDCGNDKGGDSKFHTFKIN